MTVKNSKRNGKTATPKKVAAKVKIVKGPKSSLSLRGMNSLAPPRPDVKYIFEAQADLYHPDTNPNGYLSMIVAGNKMNIKMLMAKIQKINQ